MVDRQVDGQVEQEIFRTEAEGVLAGHADRDGPIPDRQAFALVP